jgi:cyanophycinase
MSIFLAGAGPDPLAFPEVFDRFAGEVAQKPGATRSVRVAVVVHDRAGDPAARLAEYVEPLRARLSFEPVPVLLGGAGAVDPGLFDGVDAVVVGGGLTPAYLAGLQPAMAALTRTIVRGAAYLGFSAGAMVAQELALIGGYRVDGTEAPFAVDVHAAQAGTLGRAVGAVAAGLVERAVAIDENTALVLPRTGSQDFEVIGSGNCWDVRGRAPGDAKAAGGSAVVSVLRAD